MLFRSNMAVNLVHRYDRDEAEEVLSRSFAQFQADRSVVHLAKRVGRVSHGDVSVAVAPPLTIVVGGRNAPPHVTGTMEDPDRRAPAGPLSCRDSADGMQCGDETIAMRRKDDEVMRPIVADDQPLPTALRVERRLVDDLHPCAAHRRDAVHASFLRGADDPVVLALVQFATEVWADAEPELLGVNEFRFSPRVLAERARIGLERVTKACSRQGDFDEVPRLGRHPSRALGFSPSDQAERAIR